MKKVILIDDEPLARSLVKEYLQQYADIEVVCECGDGFEGVKAIQQHQPDLLFLDIQMPKINGFEMLELIDEKPSVIFTTAFDEYALKAFDANAIDYLLKPFSEERFAKAISKWREQKTTAFSGLIETPGKQPEEQQRIVVKVGSQIRIIPTNEVYYIEAYDDYVKIHTSDGYYLKKKTMTYFEQALLSSQFIRIHRSFLLNIAYITRIEQTDKESHMAVLKNQAKIPLSKTGYPKLKEVLGI